jgi:hypothetical protein
MVIPAVELSPAERDVICDAIYERARVLARAGAECIALRDKEYELEKLVCDGEAHFARVEFLQFCRSRRYRLNPLNVANALAGLPFIGCRHSIKRCRKWPDNSGGLSYGIYRILQRIGSGNIRRSELIRDAERFLRGRHPGKSFAIPDLREHWYYLRRSISVVLQQGIPMSRLASAISREYWKRKLNPNAVDRAFSTDERIVV